MHIDDFAKSYGYTAKRIYLIGLLKNELDSIVSRGWIYRAFVFGSLVNSDRADPSDIDVLLCISKHFGAACWHKVTSGDDIWIKHCQLAANAKTPNILRPCYDVEAMVRIFNEDTKSTEENIEISVAQCVELSI